MFKLFDQDLRLASNLRTFHKCAAFLKFTTGNKQANSASTLTKLLSIVLKNEILKASTFYQHKDYLAKSFLKKDFIHLFEIIYRVSKYCISGKI